MNIENKRVVWLDISKGMAISGVVIIHTGFLPFSRLSGPLLSWILPIFPFVGGYLFKKKKSFVSYLLKKFGQFMLPYVIVGIVSFLGWMYLRTHYAQNLLLFPISQTILQFILGKGIVFNGPLWFLPCYFVVVLTAKLTYPFWVRSTKLRKIVLIIVLALISLFLMTLRIDYPYSLDIAVLFLCFYFLGMYVKKQKFEINLLSFVLFVALFMLTSFLNGTIDLHQRLLHNYLLFYVSAIAGIFVIIYFSKQLAKNENLMRRFFSYLGRNSLLLLIIHWPIIQWTSYLLNLTGIPQRIGANPTITSYWLPRSDRLIVDIYIIAFLLYYMCAVGIFFYLLRLVKNRYD